ncbi:MAG: thioredoxin family protein [Acidobacteriota bacterium]
MLIALAVAATGCRGRDEAASPSETPLDHSKKSPSSSPALPFVSISFDEALAKARTENKLVFVDLYADWCTWCTKMDEDVFAVPRVQDALLAFVPIKVDVEKAGGRRIATRYRVEGLPAYLLLNADGEVVGRFDGYLPVEGFLLRLRAASGGRG